MQPDLTAGIVRILHADGSTAGTGFVVSANGLIVTCSHVVQSEHSQREGEPRPERVTAVFDAAGEPRQAIVEADWWRSHDAGDIAILRVEGDLPEGTRPFPLGPSKKSSGHPFVSRGYRLTEHFPGGLDAEGRIQSVTTYKGQPALQLLTNQIDQGMSGAPVFDTHTRRVVGMANFFWETKRHVDAWLAGAVPAETLKTVCDALALRPPQAIEDYLAAVREYCTNLPYLTLHDIRPAKALGEVYVPLKARPQPHKAEGKQQHDRKHIEHESLRLQPLSIAEVMQQRDVPHVLILGEPGAGKSTLLRQMAERAWDAPNAIGLSQPYLPLLVPLRQLASANGSLDERLSAVLKNEMALLRALPDGFLDEWPQQTGARWLIMLDALDEVPDAQRAGFIQWLNAQIENLRSNTIVITSRPSGYTESDFKEGRFRQFDLQPFTLKQSKEFARMWFDDKADDFLRELDRIRARDLSGTPLLFTIAAKDYFKNGILPSKRSGLYSEFVKTWLDEADKEKRLSAELEERLIADSLEMHVARLAHLAMRMTEQPAARTLDQLKPFIAEYLRDQERFAPIYAEAASSRFLQVMARRSGVFTRHGDTYDFIHATFREYLTALEVVHECHNDLECAWQRAVSRWPGENWKQVALFALSILDDMNCDVTQLVERISELGNNGLYFAATALAEQTRVTTDVGNRVIDDLLKAVTESQRTDFLFCWSAIDTLGYLNGWPRAADGVLRLVRDVHTDDFFRTDAAKALGRLGHFDDLWAVVGDEGIDAEVRIAAAEALNHTRYADPAATILLTMTRNETVDVRARMSAAAAMGSFSRIDDLRRLASDDDLTARVRVAAAYALTKAGYAEEGTSILLRLAHDRGYGFDANVEAAEALGYNGWVDQAVTILRALIYDTDVDVSAGRVVGALLRLDCADEVLAIARDEDLASHLRVEVAIDLASHLRVTAATDLGIVGRIDESVSILRDLARDGREDLALRLRAAKALGEAGDIAEAVPVLLELARATSRDPVEAAWRGTIPTALGKFDRLDDLQALASDEQIDVRVRIEAAEALGLSGRVDEAVGYLLALAGERGEGFYEFYECVQALQTLGRDQELMALAKDRRLSVFQRITAAQALGEVGRIDDAVSVLLPLARKEVTAVSALGTLGRVKYLAALVRDSQADMFNRILAARELGELGRSDAGTPFLIEVARDSRVSGWDRVHAAQMLGQVGSIDESASILAALVRDTTLVSSTRGDAAEALGKLRRVDELFSIVRDEGIPAEARVAAAITLFNLAEAVDEVALILISMARNEGVDAKTRIKAATALGTRGTLDEAVPTLLAVAREKDLDASVHFNAAEALVQLGQIVQALPILFALAHDESAWGWVRVRAVMALKKADPTADVVPVLQSLASDERADGSTRLRASEALDDLGWTEEAVSAWLALARDKRIGKRERTRAAEALRRIGRSDELQRAKDATRRFRRWVATLLDKARD